MIVCVGVGRCPMLIPRLIYWQDKKASHGTAGMIKTWMKINQQCGVLGEEPLDRF